MKYLLVLLMFSVYTSFGQSHGQTGLGLNRLSDETLELLKAMGIGTGNSNRTESKFDTAYRMIKYYDADYNLKVAPDAMVVSMISGYRRETYSCDYYGPGTSCLVAHWREVPELEMYKVIWKNIEIPLKNIVE